MTWRSGKTVDQAASAETFAQRERDWRNGAIVYQVLVDRFAPSVRLDAKRDLYPPPKVLRDWSEVPHPGTYLADAQLNSQELEFWGGDLASLSRRLDHVQHLGADVLYLNPIHLAYTNHKYDALDFQMVSPEFGDRQDFRGLAREVHDRGMRLVLDGVFNHMGRNAPIFQDALKNPASVWRDWFALGPQYAGGARVWTGYHNLPELNLEHPAVRDHLYADPESVVRSYLRDGADGWRLDTAFELGHAYLRDLTRAAHEEKPGSLIVGEINNYPDAWLQSIDAVMNFTLRHLVLDMAAGVISAATAGRRIDRLVRDAGIEPLLKSWVVIDNHDIPRIATQLPRLSRRRLVQALQFTLPGAPNIYYGSEVGMVGGADPENRAPMRWDLVHADNPELVWIKGLIGMRKQHRALRIGEFRLVESDRFLAFERYTERALETVVVVANPSGAALTDRVLIANAGLMDGTPMVDLLSPVNGPPAGTVDAACLTVTVPAETVMVLMPREQALGGYSRYKRIL
ncbi:glycoside hydrolase family 13 protein [Deinococcus sp. YIM 134068]|uniref:glycoside hydrolase family 13 protein n=1 Tax=Deinococcus lichenicola TaxID=3118910 RepID=UPI002F92D794